jgi:XTP/dITP diphosphohydrolase
MRDHSIDILLGTGNRHKAREIQNILEQSVKRCEFSFDDADIHLIFPWQFEKPPISPEEDGTTLAENATIKASEYANYYGLPAMADDTGLFVDALDGDPGVYAARYAGEDCTFDDNNRKLLRELENVSERKRTARFICVVALSFPEEANLEPVIEQGVLDGRIAMRYSGEEGFGYDPIFLTTSGVTLAELPLKDKNRISHRGKAIRKMFSHIATDPGILSRFSQYKYADY